MPTYQYACTACGEPHEAVQSFTDAPLTDCPQCHGRLRKVFSAVGVVFKGSGFYKNDSRGAAKGESGKGDKGDGGKSDKSEGDGGKKVDGAAAKTDGAATKSDGAKSDSKPATSASPASGNKPSTPAAKTA